MQNHDHKKNAPSEPVAKQAQSVQSVKGLSNIRLSLIRLGYKAESPEVKKIDELITKHSK